MLRGAWHQHAGSNLQPSTSYTLSADGGGFGNSSQDQDGESTDPAGTFHTRYYLPSDVTASSVTLSLTDPGTGDPVASLTVPVRRPIGRLERPVCPSARPVSLIGVGFLDGSYQLSSTSGSFNVTTVTASGGYLSPCPELQMPAIPPHQVSPSR